VNRLPLLLLALLGFGAQAALRPGLQSLQADSGLVLPAVDAKGLSADVAIPALALGAFRGLVTDYLWLRSFGLREQGRHYEARQIAEQICRLQPRLSEVWSYLAHDLAYNLAATESSPQGRWRWIRNGVALLRDQGLRLNPDDPVLYFTLSRIFQDRIGAAFDDFHMQFKEYHALEMRALLGEPPLSVETLATTPPLSTLLAQEPDARTLNTQFEALDSSLAQLARIEAELARGVRSPVTLLAESLRDTELYARLLRSARRDAVVEETRLDPERMLEIDRAWGPLDWRGCDAQAIYWALVGSEVAERQGNRTEELRLRRIAIQALKAAMRRGRITVLPNGNIILAPMVELTGRIDALYLESIGIAKKRIATLKSKLEADAAADYANDEHGHGESADTAEHKEYRKLGGFLNNQVSAREDFLGEGVILLSQSGRDKDARTLLARGKGSYPENVSFALDYDLYVIRALAVRYSDPGMFDTQLGTSQLLEGTWTSGFVALALGHDNRYRGLNKLASAARQRWDRYLSTLVPLNRARLSVPYEAIRQRALYRAAQRLSPPLRGMLAKRLGISLKALSTPPPQIAFPTPRGSR
jgi:hypothetical protein